LISSMPANRHVWIPGPQDLEHPSSPLSLEDILNRSSIVVHCIDGDRITTIFISEELRLSLGCKPGDWLSRVHPADSDRLRSALYSGGPCACEYRFRLKEGEYLWLREELQG